MKISVSTYSFGKYVEELGYREIVGKIKEYGADGVDIAAPGGTWEERIERAKVKIAELEEELDRLDAELFGEAATNYQRAAEIDTRKNEIEEELLELYDLTM